MTPLKLIETDSGKYSLLLIAGETGVDEVIYELGHEPNGYFWAGIAELLVEHEAPDLGERFSYDPEAGMFCARGTDRAALAELGELMSGAATDADRLRALVALAAATGFEFDD
ncbi:Imm51 family immunity protein [Catellatospora tritici]|uniref:Imm51 family immunity protein n=1 Tax=Catellatospora tritici TaxID=2851566 RepID=UPI001C2D3D52|nr:Imm51 family immunity protein [Catellatospora tritici]MBV1854737.1 immunity 51 family protein [Catellatospora tritici]